MRLRFESLLKSGTSGYPVQPEVYEPGASVSIPCAQCAPKLLGFGFDQIDVEKQTAHLPSEMGACVEPYCEMLEPQY